MSAETFPAGAKHGAHNSPLFCLISSKPSSRLEIWELWTPPGEREYIIPLSLLTCSVPEKMKTDYRSFEKRQWSWPEALLQLRYCCKVASYQLLNSAVHSMLKMYHYRNINLHNVHITENCLKCNKCMTVCLANWIQPCCRRCSPCVGASRAEVRSSWQ